MAAALATAGATASFAQSTGTTTDSTTTTTAPTCSGGRHHHHGILTSDERAQLKTAREKVFASNAGLKTDAENLKSQFKALRSEGKGTATEAQWQALKAQAQSFHQQMQAAELNVDPTLAPIFAKLAAAHQGWHHSS